MGIKKFRPVTETLRKTINIDRSGLSKIDSEKSLTKGITPKEGRSRGRISVRRKGGGHKRRYRIIDFIRDNHGIEGVIKTIEYDPNRTCFISLVFFKNGEKRYILSPKNIKVGAVVVSGENASISLGNSLPLYKIPVGTILHNIEMKPGKGGKLCRSAGAGSMLLGFEKDYAIVELPSKERRKIFSKCFASVGELSNEDHINISLGKAGRSRWLSRRPKVRGTAMNPVDHPHGGGEGKTSRGMHPVSPWGQLAKGYKTRDRKKPSSKFIISRRKK